MSRADKNTAVAELTEEFRTSNAAVLTEYRGLTVAQLKELRVSLAGNATYAVVKNTLTKIAAKDAGVESFDALLQGPSAIAFIKGDAVAVAKSLRDFAKINPALVIKGGVLDGAALTPADLTKLADLESREVLLSKMAGAMKASLSNAVSLFAAPLSQAARTIDALRAKAEADPSILAGGAGTVSNVAPAAAEEVAAVAETEPEAIESVTTSTEGAEEIAAEPAAVTEVTDAETPEG